MSPRAAPLSRRVRLEPAAFWPRVYFFNTLLRG